MKKIKVAIPLKTNSERIPNKNLKPFFGNESLFDVKAKQLLKTFEPSDVLVSSENPNVEKLTDKYGFKFHLRDIELTKSSAKENQIVKTITDAIDDKECDVMWVQVTQPLFDEFDEIIRVWNDVSKENDSLAVVKKISHHILDENGNPVNFNFGYWHKISQNLPNLYEVTWSAFIMRRDMLEQASYQIGRNPYLYKTNSPLVDINNDTEFEVAQILYSYYCNLKNNEKEKLICKLQ